MTSRISYTAPAVIGELHQKGYTHDFHSDGNELFWVQGQSFIGTAFNIAELHIITEPQNHMRQALIFGIVATCYNVKGIIIIRPEFCMTTSRLLLQKMGKSFESWSNLIYN